jgi:hypothetical protein
LGRLPGVWIVFDWFKTRTGVELLWERWWTFGLLRHGVCCITAENYRWKFHFMKLNCSQIKALELGETLYENMLNFVWYSSLIFILVFRKRGNDCEISISHGDEYDVQSCLLGCTAV